MSLLRDLGASDWNKRLGALLSQAQRNVAEGKGCREQQARVKDRVVKQQLTGKARSLAVYESCRQARQLRFEGERAEWEERIRSKSQPKLRRVVRAVRNHRGALVWDCSCPSGTIRRYCWHIDAARKNYRVAKQERKATG